VKTPAFQFYPGDWRKDPELRSISLTARGLWIELLCLMHESSRKGYLVTKTGNSYTNEQLARMVGVDIHTLEICLTEIEANGVSSREDNTGILFSRRMVKDAEISQERREAGKLGGNPYLLKRGVNQSHKQKPTPSSSSSSSSSSSDVDNPHTPSGEGAGAGDPTPINRKKSGLRQEFEAEFWPICWAKIGKAAALRAYCRLRKSGVPAQKIIAAAVEQGPGILTRALKSGTNPLHPATWLNQGRHDDEPIDNQANRARASPPEDDEEDWSFLDEQPEKKGDHRHV
jgi:hypothetical protein